MTLNDRVSRLEGVVEQMNQRLGNIENRLNTMMQIMVGGFIAMLVAIITVLLAVIGLYFTR